MLCSFSGSISVTFQIQGFHFEFAVVISRQLELLKFRKTEETPSFFESAVVISRQLELLKFRKLKKGLHFKAIGTLETSEN